jgi:hypothetical protein
LSVRTNLLGVAPVRRLDRWIPACDITGFVREIWRQCPGGRYVKSTRPALPPPPGRRLRAGRSDTSCCPRWRRAGAPAGRGPHDIARAQADDGAVARHSEADAFGAIQRLAPAVIDNVRPLGSSFEEPREQILRGLELELGATADIFERGPIETTCLMVDASLPPSRRLAPRD